MIKSTEVVITGGGVIGASSAYYLAREDLDVVLFEKGELASGASGANQGGCPIGLFEPPLLDLALESRRLYAELAKNLRYDIELDESGLLLCALDNTLRSVLEKHLSTLTNRGLNAKLLSKKELRKKSPMVGDFSVAIESVDDIIVNPFKLLFSLLCAAKEEGAKVYPHVKVNDITIRNGIVHSVVTDEGEVKCQYVINAAGANSPEVASMVDLKIPLKPRRGQILVTEPVPLSEYRYIIDAEYLSTAFGESDDEETTNERLKLGVASSLVQEPSGNWTIGASRDFAGFNKRTSLHTLSHMARRAIKFVPTLRKSNVIRAYAGLRPFCYEDGYPILGSVSQVGGFVFATGHAGEGIALAPVTGKLIAEEITEGKPSISIDQFRYSRFTES